MSTYQCFLKRTFDLLLSSIGLLCFWWLIIISWVAASIDTSSNGFFTQHRVGKNGRVFRVVKIKTMCPLTTLNTTVTIDGDPRITPLGALLRKSKLDELPQLMNVLLGQMSFVGPRPDVPGFADELSADDQTILSIRPGITGPATLKYRDEESLLAAQEDPEAYNRNVIWPDKVRINKHYISEWSLKKDIYFILATVFESFKC